MTPESKNKYLIVGLGLAGMSLAFRLIKRGIPFHIIDPGKSQTSSRAAAGMWNPVGFKRLNKVWGVDHTLPEVLPFFGELGDLLGEQLVFERDIYRVFPNEEAADEFEAKTQQDDFADYISMANDADYATEFGSGMVRGGGYLALRRAVELFGEWCKKEGLLVSKTFSESDALLENGRWLVEGESYDWIVTCTGPDMHASGWWGHLPLRRTKGELLHIQSEQTEIPGIVNNGKFTLPVEDGSFLCGATYNWRDQTHDKTEAAREEILDKVSKVLSDDKEIIEHRVGIRPTVSDRRPLLGVHPEHHGLAVFNGLGARGVLLAPYFSQQLVDHLEDQVPLMKEVNINRFNK
jgi:glycine oxidase